MTPVAIKKEVVRAVFAMTAMHALLASSDKKQKTPEKIKDITKYSVLIADALITKLGL